MGDSHFPDMIAGLPEADVPVEGVRGWISQAVDHQVCFLEIDAGVVVPPHSHGSQWGIVVEGEMDLTIDGETRACCKGDSYFIRAGVVHSAAFRTRVRAIDVFADAKRYGVKGAE